MKSHSIQTRLLIVLLVAFLLRLYVAAATRMPLQSDSLEYYSLATNLAQHHQYSFENTITAYRPPAYSFFLSAVLTISQSETSARVAQAFLETINCLLLFALGRKFISEHAGIWAAVLWAFFPVSIVQSVFLLSESLFTAIALGMVLLLSSNSFSGKQKPLLLGVLFGCTILTKPQSALFILPIMMFAKIRLPQKKQLLRYGFQCILGIILVVSPWVVRNVLVFGKPLISTNGGVNFWIGHNEEANGSYKIPKINPLDIITNEIERSNAGYQLGWQFIRTEPKKEAVLLIKKLGYFFSSQTPLVIALHKTTEGFPSNSSYKDKAHQSSLWMLFLFNAQYMLYLLCGTAGFIAAYNRKESTHNLFLCSFLLWILLHLMYFTMSRYNFPALPFFVLWCVHLYHNRAQVRLISKRKIIAIIFCTLGLLTLWGIELAIIISNN